ncbi:MAG: heparinase II/III family protein, partial [Anaerolineae bacterium]|nr:heparinase II/III family protein [Anaerolineae bacterium]
MSPPQRLCPLPVPKLTGLLRATPGRPPFPARADRRAWEALRGLSLAQAIVAGAEELLRQPIPPVLASEILAFARSGAREPSERSQDARRRRLALLVLAECLEGKGRLLDAALDAIWAICEESTWVMAAHLAGYRPEELPDPEVCDVDLGVADTALDLAEADYLLGDSLHPAVRRRLRYEVQRRALGPFAARDDFWWLAPRPPRHSVNNWTAVCVAGVVGAALYLEPDAERLAALLGRGLQSMEHYLATFAPDGGTAEGPGYWGYGFSHFALLSHLLECRTDGRVTLLDDALARLSARFPLRVELSPGRYAPFSDVGRDQYLPGEALAYLSRRLGEPDLLALNCRQGLPSEGAISCLSQALRGLFWLRDLPAAAPWQPAARDWIAGIDWLIARQNPADPDGLVLAVKGGHNGESHNHNDLGQYVIHWRRESLVTDLGAGRYTRQFFQAEHRYQHPATSSHGHAVPAVDGRGQLPGAEHRAEVLRRVSDEREDTVTFELRSAYPPELG